MRHKEQCFVATTLGQVVQASGTGTALPWYRTVGTPGAPPTSPSTVTINPVGTVGSSKSMSQRGDVARHGRYPSKVGRGERYYAEWTRGAGRGAETTGGGAGAAGRLERLPLELGQVRGERVLLEAQHGVVRVRGPLLAAVGPHELGLLRGVEVERAALVEGLGVVPRVAHELDRVLVEVAPVVDLERVLLAKDVRDEEAAAAVELGRVHAQVLLVRDLGGLAEAQREDLPGLVLDDGLLRRDDDLEALARDELLGRRADLVRRPREVDELDLARVVGLDEHERLRALHHRRPQAAAENLLDGLGRVVARVVSQLDLLVRDELLERRHGLLDDVGRQVQLDGLDEAARDLRRGLVVRVRRAAPDLREGMRLEDGRDRRRDLVREDVVGLRREVLGEGPGRALDEVHGLVLGHARHGLLVRERDGGVLADGRRRVHKRLLDVLDAGRDGLGERLAHHGHLLDLSL